MRFFFCILPWWKAIFWAQGEFDSNPNVSYTISLGIATNTNDYKNKLTNDLTKYFRALNLQTIKKLVYEIDSQLDIKIQTNNEIDNERNDIINNIKLESNFYNSFRNTIIKLLSENKHLKYKIRLQNLNCWISDKILWSAKCLHL